MASDSLGDGGPDAVEPGAGLRDELCAEVVVVVVAGGEVEQRDVFAEHVEDRTGCLSMRDGVLDDRVEAEEDFLAVEDVELEQRGGAVLRAPRRWRRGPGRGRPARGPSRRSLALRRRSVPRVRVRLGRRRRCRRLTGTAAGCCGRAAGCERRSTPG